MMMVLLLSVRLISRLLPGENVRPGAALDNQEQRQDLSMELRNVSRAFQGLGLSASAIWLPSC
jgi:hypothetical protein